MLKKQRKVKRQWGENLSERLEQFYLSTTSTEIRFENINAKQRKLLVQLSRNTGLIATPSKRGKSRVVTVSRIGGGAGRPGKGGKTKGQSKPRGASWLDLSESTKALLNDFWISHSAKKQASLLSSSTSTNDTSTAAASSFSSSSSSSSPSFTPLPPPVQTEEYVSLQAFRKRLPSYASRAEILDAIEKFDVVVVCGPTGCGKSTQVPQFILENFPQANIIATQPRRISAISLAERIAHERGEQVGKSVGYQIRLEGKKSVHTQLLMCTVGILLRRCVDDPLLEGVTHVIVDEVHERDRLADFLLIILKDLLMSGKRPGLKVILMSATVDGDRFSAYLNGGKVLQLTGRTFPVEQVFLEEILEKVVKSGVKLPKQKESRRVNHQKENGGSSAEKKNDRGENAHPVPDREVGRPLSNAEKYCSEVREYIRLSDPNEIDFEFIAQIVAYICNAFPLHDEEKKNNSKDSSSSSVAASNTKGAILIFLTGWAEITAVCDLLRASGLPLWVLPLHSSIPSQQQQLVFKPAPPKLRKVVVSTNIAETSVTIDDVVFVIDSGKVNELTFQSALQMSSLKPQTVSKASAAQRRGRAGRCQPGVVFHLFTSLEHDGFADYQLPEILRTPLEELCLQIKLQYPGPVAPFLAKALDPPDVKDIGHSVALLKALGALDFRENLTPLGSQLARLPCNPRLGKMILLGQIFGCLDPVLTIACCLAHRSPFVLPLPQQRGEAQKARDSFNQQAFSDHITVLRAFNEWQVLPPSQRWGFCRSNFLSNIGLGMIADIKKQFLRNLAELGYEDDAALSLNSSSSSSSSTVPPDPSQQALLRAIVSAGMNPNFALIDNTSRKPSFVTLHHHNSRIHPGSVNSGVNWYPERVMSFFEMVQTKQLYLRTTALVSPLAVILFSGHPSSSSSSSAASSASALPLSSTSSSVVFVDGKATDRVIELTRQCETFFAEVTQEERQAKAREQRIKRHEKEKEEKAQKLQRQKEYDKKIADQKEKNDKFLLLLETGENFRFVSSDEDETKEGEEFMNGSGKKSRRKRSEKSERKKSRRESLENSKKEDEDDENKEEKAKEDVVMHVVSSSLSVISTPHKQIIASSTSVVAVTPSALSTPSLLSPSVDTLFSPVPSEISVASSSSSPSPLSPSAVPYVIAKTRTNNNVQDGEEKTVDDVLLEEEDGEEEEGDNEEDEEEEEGEGDSEEDDEEDFDFEGGEEENEGDFFSDYEGEGDDEDDAAYEEAEMRKHRKRWAELDGEEEEGDSEEEEDEEEEKEEKKGRKKSERKKSTASVMRESDDEESENNNTHFNRSRRKGKKQVSSKNKQENGRKNSSNKRGKSSKKHGKGDDDDEDEDLEVLFSSEDSEEEQEKFVRSMSRLVQGDEDGDMSFNFHSELSPVYGGRKRRGAAPPEKGCIIEVNPVIRFRASARVKEQLEFLMEALQEFIARKIKDPVSAGDDEDLLDVINAVLLEEDRCIALKSARSRRSDHKEKTVHSSKPKQPAKSKRRGNRRLDDDEDFSLIQDDEPMEDRPKGQRHAVGNLTERGRGARGRGRGGGGSRGRGGGADFSRGNSDMIEGALDGRGDGRGRGGRGRGSRGAKRGSSRGTRGGSKKRGQSGRRSRKQSQNH